MTLSKQLDRSLIFAADSSSKFFSNFFAWLSDWVKFKDCLVIDSAILMKTLETPVNFVLLWPYNPVSPVGERHHILNPRRLAFVDQNFPYSHGGHKIRNQKSAFDANSVEQNPPSIKIALTTFLFEIVMQIPLSFGSFSMRYLTFPFSVSCLSWISWYAVSSFIERFNGE